MNQPRHSTRLATRLASLAGLVWAVRALPAQQPVPAESRAAAPAASRAALLLDSARHALEAGQVEPAIRLAQRYTSRNDHDPRGFVVLGDAYVRRSSGGRFQALHAYEAAVHLAPDDPEPAFLYAQAGLWLGGEEGEAVARRSLEHVLELDPFYRSAWRQWLGFRSGGARRRVRDRLERFARIPEARARMAYLDLEDELYPLADSALDGLLARDSTNVEWLAWRSQSAFEQGDVEGGALLYLRALENADRDSTDVLWRQVIGIARADERHAWPRLGRQQRTAWLASFWARRNPDLFAPINARLAEHFQRLRYARRNYPLLHPLRNAGAGGQAAPDSGLEVAAGLDDRGIACLRVGTPTWQLDSVDVEVWRYDGLGELRFAREPAGRVGAGDMAFRPLTAAQVVATQAVLGRDRTSSPAPLEFGVWTVQFQGGRPGSTEIAVVATRGAIAAELADAAGDDGGEGGVRRGNGFVVLAADPGHYTLMVHARDSARLGRQELDLDVRPIVATPALSDLLIGSTWTGPVTARFWDMLRHVSRTLVLPEGRAVRVYAEVYGLAPAGASVRYRATYRLLRTDDPGRDAAAADWPSATRFVLERETAPPPDGSGVTREVFDITPEHLPPGRYLLRLTVTDRVAEREAGHSLIAFEVR